MPHFNSLLIFIAIPLFNRTLRPDRSIFPADSRLPLKCGTYSTSLIDYVCILFPSKIYRYSISPICVAINC